MSVWVTGYTEAMVHGKWHCIDFYQYGTDGKLHHVPCIQGQSMVRSALEWDCQTESMIGAPGELSDEVRRMCSSKDGVLFGTGEEKWYSWRVIDGNWFAKANLDLPEFCGFFPRQDVCRYLSNPDENELNSEAMLSAEEYRELDEEAKKAYQYFEYTEPFGSREILRRLKRNVMERVWAFNDSLLWGNRDQKISLSDVRVLTVEG